jgi:hypothetical protein
MKAKKTSVIFVAIIIFIITVGALASASEAGKKIESLSTSREDQKRIALTIYNTNLGLVKDQRELQLPIGTVELKFMDVASQIIPASVYIKSLVKSDSLQVLEQNYEYDLLNPQKLMDKYVGKEVKFYATPEVLGTATLLSNNNGPIFKIGDNITTRQPGELIFPGIPENLISKPTLVWLLENTLSSLQEVEASYLTKGISWRADYVLTLNDKDDKADLAGWVTIDNKSGATYKDASIKIVAGDVNTVEDHDVIKQTKHFSEALTAKAQFKEEGFVEYHIYTLQRSATVKDNQTKQISLINAGNIKVKKEFIFYGAQNYYRSHHTENISNQKVGVYVEVVNRKEDNLGMPLPKGTIRVYKKDSDGSLQFAGEDSIDHTPKDEKVRVKLGDAFDVLGTRTQTDWQKMANDTYEAEFEISLRNHKEEDVVVKVIEPIPGDWKILSSSHDYKKTEAFAAEFSIPVPKDNETKLTYRVRMRF